MTAQQTSQVTLLKEGDMMLFVAVVGKPTVENCLSGFNSSVFAYGQTGSGKTYTMVGELPQGDVLPANVSISDLQDADQLCFGCNNLGNGDHHTISSLGHQQQHCKHMQVVMLAAEG